MNDLKVAIVGPGRMGMAVAERAPESGFSVSAMIAQGGLVSAATLKGANVAIEFTEPAAAVANAKACVLAGVPVVVGTTGWHDQLDELSDFVQEHSGALLWSSNFSIGVQSMAALLRNAGAIFAPLDAFEAALVETHHAAKKDAPSGTAIMLRDALRESWPRDVPVTSVRVGSVPGTHTVIIDGPFEQITISHEARDRRVFADGALVAARWLVGRSGVFTMSDVVAAKETE